jgi:hypothetical protein
VHLRVDSVTNEIGQTNSPEVAGDGARSDLTDSSRGIKSGGNGTQAELDD